jgi:hypothetical protein
MGKKQPPETIYLQWGDGSGIDGVSEITWCDQAVEDDDIEYVRADLTEQARAEIGQLRKRLEETTRAGADELERAERYRRRALALTGLRGKERREEFLPRLERAVKLGEHWKAEVERLRAALASAHDALRSYQYGNGSPELAKEVADRLQKELKGGE